MISIEVHSKRRPNTMRVQFGKTTANLFIELVFSTREPVSELELVIFPMVESELQKEAPKLSVKVQATMENCPAKASRSRHADAIQRQFLHLQRTIDLPFNSIGLYSSNASIY